MKLQFDPNQQFQLDAVSAAADLFEGQLKTNPSILLLKRAHSDTCSQAMQQTELAIGNRISITEDNLKKNLRTIQLRNDIETIQANLKLGSTLTFQQICQDLSLSSLCGDGNGYGKNLCLFENHF